MVVVWLRVFSLIAIASLLVFEEWVSNPACKFVPTTNDNNNDTLKDVQFGEVDPDKLRVMLVAELLLLGSESGYVNHFFRDYYMAKFFRVIPCYVNFFPPFF